MKRLISGMLLHSLVIACFFISSCDIKGTEPEQSQELDSSPPKAAAPDTAQSPNKPAAPEVRKGKIIGVILNGEDEVAVKGRFSVIDGSAQIKGVDSATNLMIYSPPAGQQGKSELQVEENATIKLVKGCALRIGFEDGSSVVAQPSRGTKEYKSHQAVEIRKNEEGEWVVTAGDK